MEVEVKLRLTKEAQIHDLERALGSPPFAIDEQENFFFDGLHGEL